MKSLKNYFFIFYSTLAIFFTPFLCASNPLYVGSAIALPTLLDGSEPLYNLTLNKYATVIAGGMKFNALHYKSRYVYDFSTADKIVEYAIAHNMKVRGHCLAWGSAIPSWVQKGNYSSIDLENILVEHITTVIQHFSNKYPGVVFCWDVVNEAYTQEYYTGRPIWAKIRQYFADGSLNPNWDPLRDYVRVAFNAARAADPNVKLFYNDYRNDRLYNSSNNIFTYVQGLKAEGLPIDGIGMQCHFDVTADTSHLLSDLTTNMQRYANLGLDIHVTELDVKLPVSDSGEGYYPTNPADLNTQATIYSCLAQACAANPACKALLTWGFTYKHSWIPNACPGYGAATPFDQNYMPTPAYQALYNALLPLLPSM